MKGWSVVLACVWLAGAGCAGAVEGPEAARTGRAAYEGTIGRFGTMDMPLYELVPSDGSAPVAVGAQILFSGDVGRCLDEAAKTGRRVRIAGTPIVYGDGSEVLRASTVTCSEVAE